MIPSKAHWSDVGYDLTALEKYSDDYGNIVYDTKLAIEVPAGYAGLLFPRSSISKKALALANAVGVIDPGYTGSIILKLKPTIYYDSRKEDEPEEYEVGDKVGQLLIIKTEDIEFSEVDDLRSTARGSGGFGSSDSKIIDNLQV